MHSVFLPSPKSQGHSVNVARAITLPTAIPEHCWPIWATAIAFFKGSSDAGVGDTVERIIGKPNSAAFKAWHTKTFGKSCGCSERKSLWNAKFPYKQH